MNESEPIRVLQAEDNQMVLELVGIFLSEAGINLEQFSSPLMALSRFEQDPKFDVLMTDFQMPGMDGIRLAREIKARSNDIGILVLSSKALDEIIHTFPSAEKEQLLQLIDCHVLKPFYPQPLIEAVELTAAKARQRRNI